MSVQREARRDAKEFARAKVYYGEGAGVRRRLIEATVDSKSSKSQAYAKAFHQALAHQDMEDHVNKAHRQRVTKDTTAAVNKNVRGLVTGNYQSVNTSVLILVGAAFIAHRTGFDRKVYEEARIRYYRLKRKLKKNAFVPEPPRKIHTMD